MWLSRVDDAPWGHGDPQAAWCQAGDVPPSPPPATLLLRPGGLSLPVGPRHPHTPPAEWGPTEGPPSVSPRRAGVRFAPAPLNAAIIKEHRSADRGITFGANPRPPNPPAAPWALTAFARRFKGAERCYAPRPRRAALPQRWAKPPGGADVGWGFAAPRGLNCPRRPSCTPAAARPCAPVRSAPPPPASGGGAGRSVRNPAAERPREGGTERGAVRESARAARSHAHAVRVAPGAAELREARGLR